MADEELGSASVSIELDDEGTSASLDRLSDRIERALSDAARDGARRMKRQLNLVIRKINPLKIEVTADLTRFRAALNTVNNLGSTEITVVPSVDPERFRRELQRRVRGIYIRIPVRPDFDGFDDLVRAHRPPAIDVRVEPEVNSRAVQRSLSALSGALGKVGNLAKVTLGFGALGIAAAGAASAVAGLVAALAPAAGIIAAGPAVILGYQAALGALKLALSGVSDAFSTALTGSAEEFEKSLENLSPKAQAAAREVRALKPAFEDLRSTVQDSFFKRIEGDITRTAEALQGPLTRGLRQIADSWGGAANGVLGYIQGSRGVNDVNRILIAANQATQGLADGSNKLTAGFLQAGAAISEAFGKQLESGLSTITQRFGTFLQTVSADGRLVAWVDGALSALATLGAVIGNIGGILAGVFGAADTAGGGFLVTLNKTTQAFEDFVNEAETQQALANVFRTLATVGAQLAPIFQSLVGVIGQIAPAIAPLLTAIGPAIVSVIQALGPLIQGLLPGINAVVDGIVTAIGGIASSGVLTDVGAAFGTVLTAIAPLLPVVGELVASLAQALAPVLQLVAEAVAPIVSALSAALLPILPPLVDVVLQLVDAFAPLVDSLGVALAQVITALAPLLLTVATALGTIAEALTPLIAQVTDALLPIFEALAPAITQIVEAITPLITQLVSALLPALPPLIEAYVAIYEAILPLIPIFADLVAGLAPLVTLVLQALGPLLTFAANIVKWLSVQVVVPVIENLIGVIRGIVQAATDVVDGIRQFVTTVVGFFTKLYNDGRRIIGQLVDGISATFRRLPGLVTSVLSQLGSAISSTFTAAKNVAVRSITDLVNSVVRVARELPGKVRSGLGALSGYLVSAGADLIRGMINGIRSMAGALVDSAKSVVSGAVNGAKALLGIKSPSRVFRQIGVFVGQGLVNGLTASEASIEKTSERLAKLITDAFKGQKTLRDDNLLRTVKTTQTQLERLVRQREALAERIKKANEFAASTTQAALQSFGLNTLFDRVNQNIASLKERTTVSNRPGLKIDVIGDLTKQLDASAARIRRFNKQVTDLAKRGLRRDLIEQLIGLGPEAGADLAQQLSLASNKQIKDLNAAQSRLNTAATKFGKDSADKMFDAGKQAANGFLAGLKGQQKALQDLMVSIAKGLSKAIRQALGIKSPSRVFQRIGEQTVQGLVRGIARMSGVAAGASASLAGRVTAGFGGPAALSAVSDPFGTGRGPVGLGAVNGAQRAAHGLGAVTAANGRVVNIEQGAIVINEVGNAESTATRVVNRLVGTGVAL